MTGRSGRSSWTYVLKLGIFCIREPGAQLILMSLHIFFDWVHCKWAFFWTGLLLCFSFFFIYGFSVFHCFDSHCVLLQDIWSLLCVSPSTLISTSFPISPRRIVSKFSSVKVYRRHVSFLPSGSPCRDGYRCWVYIKWVIVLFYAFAVIFWITIFWVGKQAVGESYGNVKMPGNGFWGCAFFSLSLTSRRDTFVLLPYCGFTICLTPTTISRLAMWIWPRA